MLTDILILIGLFSQYWETLLKFANKPTLGRLFILLGILGAISQIIVSMDF